MRFAKTLQTVYTPINDNNKYYQNAPWGFLSAQIVRYCGAEMTIKS